MPKFIAKKWNKDTNYVWKVKERERDKERKEIPWTYHLLMTSYMSGPMLELYTYSLTHLGLNV